MAPPVSPHRRLIATPSFAQRVGIPRSILKAAPPTALGRSFLLAALAALVNLAAYPGVRVRVVRVSVLVDHDARCALLLHRPPIVSVHRSLDAFRLRRNAPVSHFSRPRG